MTSAFLFYFACSFKNRVGSRLRRLRRPKYLISALAGSVYVYFIFLHQLIWGSGARVQPAFSRQGNVDLLSLMEIGFALLLLGLVLMPWILPSKGVGITFTEAEIQFLFPAPLSRRSLIHFRLMKGQLGILFAVLVSFLVSGRDGAVSNSVYLVLNLWLVFSFLALYRIGTSMAQSSLTEHGMSGLKRQLWVLILVLLTVGSVGVWLKWFIPATPEIKNLSPGGILRWISQVAESGPAFYFLLPFRALVRPALAHDAAFFLLHLLPASLILGFSYAWVIRSDVAFEEASLERSEKAARMLDSLRGGTLQPANARPGKIKRPWFHLGPNAPPFLAIFWKNLISAGRFDPRFLIYSVLIVFAGNVALVLSAGSSKRALVVSIMAGIAGGLAAVFPIVGPLTVRDDLRKDLLRVDLIKTYPIPGWVVVLGEVLAPAAILALKQWGLLLLAAIFLPSAKIPWSLSQHVVLMVGAAILFPCLSLMGILVQNAAALIMPGWVQLGKEHQQGIEAMGQRIITTIATLLILLFAVIPAAFLFALVFLLGYWLIGLAVVPLAALIAAVALLLEAAVVIAWLGQLFDGFDASLEMETTGDG